MGCGCAAHVADSRSKGSKVERVATVIGQVQNLPGLDGRGEVGGLGVEVLLVRGYIYGIAGLADFHFEVCRVCLGDGDVDTGLRRRGEAGRDYLDDVVAWIDEGNAVASLRIGGQLFGFIGTDFADSDRCAGNCISCGVCDSSSYGSGGGLS